MLLEEAEGQTYLVETMAWLAMRAKTACPGSRMRKGAITESAVVLKRWAIFPAKEQALAHFEEGSIVELVAVGIKVAGWRVIGVEAE
jgi:hypothetical protein